MTCPSCPLRGCADCPLPWTCQSCGGVCPADEPVCRECAPTLPIGDKARPYSNGR